jgi:ABC-type branched-subunit amino acid transport system ATPase component
MVSEPVLAVSGVQKSFGGLRVLRGVELAVAAGSITGLIGPNGSGKSTLFDIVTRYLPCDAGDVRLGGESLLRLAPHQVSRRGLVRTFQLTRVFPNLTVADNVLVFADRSDRRPGGEARAAELLDFVGLLRLAQVEAGTLSYGQQKLLELAQVLTLEPRVLLLDEPMAGINPGLADELAGRLCQLRDRGLTLLLVEHDIPVVQRICDTVAVLADGRVLASGKPAEVLADREIREVFLGD